MYNYIGIRGHRGSGKSSISMLLGMTLQYLMDHKSFNDDFDACYDEFVKEIKSGTKINELAYSNVCFDTFADAPIALINMIFNIPTEWCYEDTMKDKVVVNLRTFESSEKDQQEVVTAKEYFEMRNSEIDCELNPRTIKEDVYMTLRELISYYGNYVMKYFFGANVWVKSLSQTQNLITDFFTGGDDQWKIYTDVKFTAEVDYIKSNKGIIINLERPDYKKDNFDASTNLAYDTRIDYTITYNEICEPKTKDIIKQIAKQIYESKN